MGATKVSESDDGLAQVIAEYGLVKWKAVLLVNGQVKTARDGFLIDTASATLKYSDHAAEVGFSRGNEPSIRWTKTTLTKTGRGPNALGSMLQKGDVITGVCPGCKERISVRVRLDGFNTPCPKCGTWMYIGP